MKKLGNLFSGSKEKAEILAQQFQSVFTRVDPTAQPIPINRKQTKPIPTLTITLKGVEKLLANINTSKAIGPDMISNIILKTCAHQLAPGLTAIYQTSINSGQLPSDWCNAFVTPIFKKGNVHLPENYRPVSLTCVCCKLLEHIICRHILTHLENNNILTSLQHGFRSGYSCETQLITTIQDLIQKNDMGHQIDMIILDFSKAFDMVPHLKLMDKLENYGVDGHLHKWIYHFLSQRHMQIVVEGDHSEPVTVDSGVPQGTVMGPLLFLCYINDLPDAVKSQVRLFADDSLLYRTIKTRKDHEVLQADLAALEDWANKWGMKFNATKCYVMSINQKSSNFYTLCNYILQQVKENPYLGLTITEDLKWDQHITNIVKKANSALWFLKRNLKHCPQQCRRSAYLSLVRSTLEYSSSVWDPYLKKNINRLEKVQRQAARFVSGDYRSRDEGCVTKMLEDLSLPSLEARRRNNRLVFFYKVVEGLVPAIKCPSVILTPERNKRRINTKKYVDFETNNIIENQVLNNTKCFKTINCKGDLYRQSFFPKTIINWNNLEDSVVCAQTLESFKTALPQCY